RDEAGYFRFVGRDDDLITSGGYRIGPGEIEACLSRHPAVALAAVVGEPDPIRTEAVKAVIVLKEGFAPGEALKSELQEHVRSRLAAYEYPRIVEFVRELPLTATGKIIRRALDGPREAARHVDRVDRLNQERHSSMLDQRDRRAQVCNRGALALRSRDSRRRNSHQRVEQPCSKPPGGSDGVAHRGDELLLSPRHAEQPALAAGPVAR